MAMIQSLPTELLHRILELGSLWPDSGYPSGQYDFLGHSSLVCRSWSTQARALLEKRVVLNSVEAVEAFVNLGGKRGITRELVLGAGGERAQALAAAVVDCCEGLKAVSVCDLNNSYPLTALTVYLRDPTALQEFFRACTSLRSLNMRVGTAAHLIPFLPTPLEKFTPSFPVQNLTVKELRQLRELLQSKFIALSALRTLRLHDNNDERFKRKLAAHQLLAVCEERGIEVFFTDYWSRALNL